MLQNFKRFLESQKIKIKSEKPERIQFETSEGFICEFIYDSTDPYFFQIIVPFIYRINESNRANYIDIALKITTEFKTVKVVLVDNYFWLSIEQFIPYLPMDSETRYEILFIRILSVIKDTINSLQKHILEHHKQNSHGKEN